MPVSFLSDFLVHFPSLILAPDKASPDDPNEISFSKGEVLDIVDKQGKWWQAKKADGTIGSKFYFPPLYTLLTTFV